ncbi:MAG TPA: hypothetical protein VFM54_23340 [Micromonosporaceae bacterium]|nr:hypothetical protein [Micromonosporaceae bacterium]
MASLATIRTTVKSVLNAALGTGVEVYPAVPSNPVLPCVCVVPETADYVAAMGRGTDTWTFTLFVLVPSGDPVVAQGLLDPYVTGAGSSSVRQAVFNARTTFQAAGFDAHVAELLSYGGQLEAVGTPHTGASLRLIVHTPGTE